MACTGTRSSLSQLWREASSVTAIPSFLAPAVSRSTHSRRFSTAPIHASRIGSAAISIPPEVSLRFYDLSKAAAGGGLRRDETPKSAVEVTGPLGESRFHAPTSTRANSSTGQITLPLPPYLITNHDEESRKVMVRVEDSTLAHQRAMWGGYPPVESHLANYYG